MYLIVGLGNPGSKYEHTRHNVGFDVLALLSEKLKTPVARSKSKALVGETLVAGQKVVLCKPQTYMNLSGEAVQALMRWYRVQPQNLLVIYDDIDLPPGTLRIRREGSAGTHNGMRSIIAAIGTQAFPRIRVGVGVQKEGYELADWVLSHYTTPAERQTAYDAYCLAAEAAMEFVQNGIDSAMQKYSVKKPAKQKEKPEAPKTEPPSPGSPSGQPTPSEGAAE